MSKPRLNDSQRRLAWKCWTKDKWDTKSIADLLHVREAAVYNSLYDMRGGDDGGLEEKKASPSPVAAN